MLEEFGEQLIRDQRTIHPESPDPSDSQLHVGASLQFTSLIFCRVQVRGLGRPKASFCLVMHFCGNFDVCFWLSSWWKIQPQPMIRFLTSIRFRFFLSVGIWQNPWCSVSEQQKHANNIKDSAVNLMDYLGKGEVLTNTDLDRFVNNILEK